MDYNYVYDVCSVYDVFSVIICNYDVSHLSDKDEDVSPLVIFLVRLFVHFSKKNN